MAAASSSGGGSGSNRRWAGGGWGLPISLIALTATFLRLRQLGGRPVSLTPRSYWSQGCTAQLCPRSAALGELRMIASQPAAVQALPARQSAVSRLALATEPFY